MEDLWLLFALAYVVLSLFGRSARQDKARRQSQQQARARARERTLAEAMERAERLARARASRPAPVPARVPAEPEEAYSLELVREQGESREVAPVRAPRSRISAEEEAEAIVRRRIAEAEARIRALTPDDHEAFHRRLAAARAAEATPEGRRRSAAELRRAIIWREVLGPPLALREGGRD